MSRKFDIILRSNGMAFAGCYAMIQPITSARTDKIRKIGNPAARVSRKSFTSKHLDHLPPLRRLRHLPKNMQC